MDQRMYASCVKYGVATSDVMHAVWSFSVCRDFRNKGWPVNEDELGEAIAVFRAAEALGTRIPSMAEACEWMCHG